MSTYPETLLAPWLDRAAAVGLDIPDLQWFARSDGRMCVTGCEDCRNIRNQVREAEQKAAAEARKELDAKTHIFTAGFLEALYSVRESVQFQHQRRIMLLQKEHDMTMDQLDEYIAEYEGAVSA